MDVDPGVAVERENARVGYEVAVSLVASEGNLVWARYGLMLVAHSIILAAIGLASDAEPPVRTVVFVGLSVVGLVLCFAWWQLNDVGFRYFFYWVFSARELEERYLSPTRVISRGFPLMDSDEVSVTVGGQERRLPVYRKDRVRVVGASRLVIVVIGLLYVALLVYSIAAAMIPVA